jgi:hypothetical protein
MDRYPRAGVSATHSTTPQIAHPIDPILELETFEIAIATLQRTDL